MSTISDANSTWADAFIAESLNRLKSWMGAEPTEEPSRTFWHSEWNGGIASLAYQARRAYREERGVDAPASLVEHIHSVAQPFFTNPYPGETVAERVAGFIRRGIDTPEAYATKWRYHQADVTERAP